MKLVDGQCQSFSCLSLFDNFEVIFYQLQSLLRPWKLKNFNRSFSPQKIKIQIKPYLERPLLGGVKKTKETKDTVEDA